MKTFPYHPSFSMKQRGYSIVEWMIVIFLTLFLTAGLLTVFISSKRATDDSLNSSERLENGSFALQLLTKDLKQAYFFAQATGENKSLWDVNGAIIANSADCLDDSNSGTFPSAGNYRQIWASTVPASIANLKMSCINDDDSDTSLITNSGYIDIKRVKGLAQVNNFEDDRYYLDITPSGITVYQGNASALLNGTVSPAWEYIRHVYYLDKENDIPRLRRLNLQKNAMVREEVLVEGIENMQFMFALDHLIASERDGSVHAFVGTSQVTANDWNTGRVIGIKILLLARSLRKTPGYENTDIYQLGDLSFTAPGDAYKRELLSQVLIFQNSVVLVDD